MPNCCRELVRSSWYASSCRVRGLHIDQRSISEIAPQQATASLLDLTPCRETLKYGFLYLPQRTSLHFKT